MKERQAILQLRKEQFLLQITPQTFITNRTLESGANNYKEGLPLYKGKNVVQIIDEKVKNSKHFIRILDIGCGEARFLTDCKERHGENVICEGLTSYPYYEVNPEMVAKIKECRVKITIGDAHLLTAYYPRDSYDVVVSAYAFRYLTDPLLALRRAYAVAKPEAIGLIGGIPLFTRNARGERMTNRERKSWRMSIQNKYNLVLSRFYGDSGYCDAAFEKKPRLLQVGGSYYGVTEFAKVPVAVYKVTR